MRPISVAVPLVLATMLIACGAGVARAGTLTGTLSDSAAVNRSLTAAGNIDWAIWGFADNDTSTSLTPDDHKAGGAGISALTDISNGTLLRGIGQFGVVAHTVNWTDGTPVPSGQLLRRVDCSTTPPWASRNHRRRFLGHRPGGHRATPCPRLRDRP